MRSTFTFLVVSVFTVWLVAGSVCAADWEVVRTNKAYFLKLPGFPDLTIELKSFGGVKPQPLSPWRKAPKPHSHLRLISYDAGKSGQGRIIYHRRSIVLDPAKRRVLGDVPSGYVVSTTPRAEQPQWRWGPNVLVVNDTEFNHELRIPLSN